MQRVFNILRKIESRVQLDEGNRGINNIIPEAPQLYQGSLELLKCRSIGILTGFPCLFDKDIRIESDGIAGALCIARSLHELGISSTILIDSCFIPNLQPLLTWHNQEFQCEISCSGSFDLTFDGMISIERTGRAKDGNYYTMRALKMTDATELDTIYLDTMPSKIRVAIGDGGNEAGLGPVNENVRKYVRNGEIIASCSMSDYVLISSVSTWGGYSLALALSLLGNSRNVLSLDHEEKVTRKIMDLGICDGILRVPHMGVDGLEWEYTSRFIQDILNISIQEGSD